MFLSPATAGTSLLIEETLMRLAANAENGGGLRAAALEEFPGHVLLALGQEHNAPATLVSVGVDESFQMLAVAREPIAPARFAFPTNRLGRAHSFLAHSRRLDALGVAAQPERRRDLSDLSKSRRLPRASKFEFAIVT